MSSQTLCDKIFFIGKFIELVEENKKLYEQLLPSEREKTQPLQRLLDKQ